jgi:hypothetical protein
MKTLLIWSVIARSLFFAVSCSSASNSYIGYYIVAVPKLEKAQAASEVRIIAQVVSQSLGYTFEIIDERDATLQIMLKPKTENAPVVVLTCQRAEEYSVSVIKNGRDEDEFVREVRTTIEAALNSKGSGKWTFRLAHSSFARP